MTIVDLASPAPRDYLQGTPGTYFAEDHPPLKEVGRALRAFLLLLAQAPSVLTYDFFRFGS
jgi:hypothetical protein